MDRDPTRRTGRTAAFRSLAHLAVVKSTTEPSFAAWRSPRLIRSRFHLVARSVTPESPLWLRRWFPAL